MLEAAFGEILDKHGPWAVCLVVVSVLSLRFLPAAGTWLANNFFSPIREAVVGHLSAVDTSTKETVRHLGEMGQHVTEIANGQQTIVSHQHAIASTIVDAMESTCPAANCPVRDRLAPVLHDLEAMVRERHMERRGQGKP